MAEIDEVTNIIIGFCVAGVIIRVIINSIRMMIGEPEEIGSFKKKIKNSIVFLAISLSIFSLEKILESYFT